MNTEENNQSIEQIKQFAQEWNELYTAEKFDEMKELATEDVGIANAVASVSLSGLIFGQEAYKKRICEAYYGASGKEHNLIVMKYEAWEYIPLDSNTFYTIGLYTLEPDNKGVNCWLLRRHSSAAPWKIFRVINN